MNDMPPKTEPIVIVRKQTENEDYHGILSISMNTWQQMHDHAERIEIPISKFINIAIKRYIKELDRAQEEKEVNKAFSETHLSSSAIKPNPNWWYHLDDKQGS